MSENEGILQLQPSGRWAIVRPGHIPVEITSGDLFRVEMNGELKVTRMEFRDFTGPMKGHMYRGQPGSITQSTVIIWRTGCALRSTRRDR